MRGLATAITLILGFTAVCAAADEGIQNIGASEQTIRVKFAADAGRVSVVELEPLEDYSTTTAPRIVWTGGSWRGKCKFARFDGKRDRLYSKFLLLDAKTGKSIGATHYVVDLSRVKPQTSEYPWPASMKGLSCPVLFDELQSLGVKHVTTNVMFSQMFVWDGSDTDTYWEVDGHKLPINKGYFENLDSEIKRLNDLGICVTVVLNNPVPKSPDPNNPLIHPLTALAEAPYHLGAFNITDERGLLYYRGAMEYLAHRYSDPESKHGWISGYIVGNEITTHWYWYNIGEMELDPFIEQYGPVLHIADLAVRQVNPNTRVYVSLEHHWNKLFDANPGRSFRGKEFMEKFTAWSRLHGDFPWNVAYHPYPEDLFHPDFWNDHFALVSFDTPLITFKNLEVLPAFLRKKSMLYNGKPRRIILSEQGFHAAESKEGELLQAAAYAAAYYRVSKLPDIDAFMLHRHVSSRDEEGLRLGLRDFDVKTKLPIYDVFRMAGTDQWEKAFAFAKPIIGIKDWSELDPVKNIPESIDIYSLYGESPKGLVADLCKLSDQAKLVNVASLQSKVQETPRGLRLAMMEHPTPSGTGKATFAIQLPAIGEKERLVLHFFTTLNKRTKDGVLFSVEVNGEEVWALHQDGHDAREYEIDLSSYAGQTVALSLCVNGGATLDFDWAHWVLPQVIKVTDK